jgi:hypothetical protein
VHRTLGIIPNIVRNRTLVTGVMRKEVCLPGNIAAVRCLQCLFGDTRNALYANYHQFVRLSAINTTSQAVCPYAFSQFDVPRPSPCGHVVHAEHVCGAMQ